MHGGGENEPVTGEVLGRAGKVHLDIAIVERVIEKLDMVTEIEKLVGLHGLLQSPIIVMAVKDAGFGLDVSAFKGRSQQFQFVAKLGNFLKNATISAGIVREHGAVELLRTEAGLTPAEEKNGGRAAGNQLIGEHAQHTRPYQGVDILPGDVARLLLHDPKAIVTVGGADFGFFKRTEHVNFAGQLGGFGFERGGAFDGDKIDDLGEVEVIEAVEERAQICRDRALGSQLVEQVSLHFDELHDGVAAKAAPIEHERRVMNGGGVHGHGDLVPTFHDLPPMAQAHELVHAFDRLVFGFEPEMPVAARVLVEGRFGIMAAEAIIDLPGDELRVLAERFGHVFDNALGKIPKQIAVQADGAAGAFALGDAALIQGQYFRMFFREPDGWSGGWSGQDDFDAGLAEDIHDPLEPSEIALAFFRLAKSPGKFAEANHIDTGLDHQFGVTLPGSFGVLGRASVRVNPLFGMIIDAEIHKLLFRVRPL